MSKSKAFTRYLEHTGSRQGKVFKSTLFQGEHLMVGLNCLEPGQAQPLHRHEQQDKFYLVLEGSARVTVGDDRQLLQQGELAWAPAGVEHGVEAAEDRTVLLVGISPPPGPS